MSEPMVGFRSRARRLRVLLGFDEDGKPVYAETREHECHTSDPEVVEAFSAYAADFPHELEVIGGGVVCPVCFKVLKDEFGLKGHMRSHDKGGEEQ